MTTGSMKRKRNDNKRLSWLTEAQAAVGWGIILVLVAILGTVYLRQASRIAVTGRRVQIRQNDLIDLKRENADVELKIAEAQSLERLQAKAEAMGFILARPENLEYLIIPDYPAETAVSPIVNAAPEAEAASPPPATMEEALFLAFKASVSNLIEGKAGEQ